MPTPLDRATNSRGLFFTFAAVVTGVAAWSIWGQDMFPSSDPTGDPETWTHDELTTWLRNRNLHPSPVATSAELLERVKANMQIKRD
ncbi:hypothetical protein BS50DRAFT_45996 [Corynespora cassiicola Philippines]|uniref:STE24 endopeptidase n=1 Tax=Corynespora cassiicola Philippines TaxID=1448308 RepID=A0A2T2NHD2_CORCC|nr:hypothetical protein BS50DRAFT_45996 [Corynespora cassiicola Philippines]